MTSEKKIVVRSRRPSAGGDVCVELVNNNVAATRTTATSLVLHLGNCSRKVQTTDGSWNPMACVIASHYVSSAESEDPANSSKDTCPSSAVLPREEIKS